MPLPPSFAMCPARTPLGMDHSPWELCITSAWGSHLEELGSPCDEKGRWCHYFSCVCPRRQSRWFYFSLSKNFQLLAVQPKYCPVYQIDSNFLASKVFFGFCLSFHTCFGLQQQKEIWDCFSLGTLAFPLNRLKEAEPQAGK